MSQEVLVRGTLVRGTLRKWDLVLAQVVSLAVLVVGLLFLARGWNAPGLACAALGLLLIVLTIVAWNRRLARRQWAWDTGVGFVVSDRRGEREYQDAEVSRLALRHDNHYSGGILSSFTRVLTITIAETEAADEMVTLTTTFKPDQPDPLVGLIDRLCTRLFEQAQEDLRRGQAVQGDCWAWSGRELTVRGQQGVKHCPLDEVSAVEVVGDDICIWRHGQDEVYARVPRGSTNAYLLDQLLIAELGKRPPDTAPRSDGHLGRILFERNSRKNLGLAVVLALLLALAGIGCLTVLPLTIKEPGVGILIGLGLLLASALAAWYAAWCRTATFRCHEFGVYQRGLGKECVLPYGDVEAFTYSAIRQFVHGTYTGTALNMIFEPGPGGQRIAYSTTLKNPDQALEGLRDSVAHIVAAKMAQQLSAAPQVVWTPQLSFQKTGLACKPKRLFGAKVEEFVPYDEVTGFDIKEGFFYLWVRHGKKALVRENVAVRNFFPGYFLFLSLVPGTRQPLPPPLPAQQEQAEH